MPGTCGLLSATATRLGSAFALVAAMVAASPLAAATITVSVVRSVEAIDVQASTTVQADAATAWRVLTDYDRYIEFIPDLLRSHVVARSGSKVTVEQSGFAAIWLLKVPVQVTFEVDENPPNGLQSRSVSGSLRSLTSNYVLTPVPSGTRLDYLGHVAPGFEFFGRIEQAAVEHYDASTEFRDGLSGATLNGKAVEVKSAGEVASTGTTYRATRIEPDH
jgi:ribosome-associated toxin RatA of RatAB toxin-antitoxin module